MHARARARMLTHARAHTGMNSAPEIVEMLKAGQAVALVSDAGMFGTTSNIHTERIHVVREKKNKKKYDMSYLPHRHLSPRLQTNK